MIPEIENNKTLNFKDRTEKDIDHENAKIDFSPGGVVIRNNHSHYYGMVLSDSKGKMRLSTPFSFEPSKGYVRQSKVHGYGVFALNDIKVGDVIEEMFCILLDTTESSNNDWVINRYAFSWDCDCNTCKANGKTLFITTGNGMMYNHADVPNAHLFVEKIYKKAKMVALRDIQKDEEIFHYYGSDYSNRLLKQKELNKRPDVPEGMPGLVYQRVVPMVTVDTPSIIKGSDGTEFKTRA